MSSSQLEAMLQAFPQQGSYLFYNNGALASQVLQEVKGDIAQLPRRVQQALLRSRNSIENLKLSKIQGTPETFQTIIKTFPNLRSLDLSHSNLSDKELSLIASLSKL